MTQLKIQASMKCIIFDCDGVLVDSEMITTHYFIKRLAQLGYQISPEEAIKRFTGKSDQAVYTEISAETGLIFTPELIQEIQAYIHGSLHAEVQAITGMMELLTLLQAKNDRAICVASSGTLDKIYKSLRSTQLIDFFHTDAIFSIQHVTRGKPAPDLFLYAAEKMGFEPHECLVIEDSVAGIQAAQAAHIPVIGFLGGSHAQLAWYRQQFNFYHIPLAHDALELRRFLLL